MNSLMPNYCFSCFFLYGRIRVIIFIQNVFVSGLDNFCFYIYIKICINFFRTGCLDLIAKILM